MTESEKLIELAKRRGFFFLSQESYGGAAGFYTYGPEGASVKANLESEWRRRFKQKEGNLEVDAPTVMREPVFEASGHLEGFDDMIVECPECGASSRADHIIEDNTEIEEAESFSPEKAMTLIEENDLVCPECGAELAGVEVNDFNLMFETSIGPGSSNLGYLRPETAQGIFVEFPRLKEYARNQLPFGVTQIGRAYRNEISPRNALVRTREFTQAELELFIDPERDEPELNRLEDVKLNLYPADRQGEGGEAKEMTIAEAIEKEVIESEWIAYYLATAQRWYRKIGIDMNRFRFRQHQAGERAHYASDCWDAETEIGEGEWLEIAGFAYRGCYDLKKHDEYSSEDYSFFREYDNPKKVEKTIVNVEMSALGPEFGEKASAIAAELEKMAEEQSEELQSGEVTVEVEDESFTVDSDLVEIREETVEENGEHFIPHIVEPSFGVDRTLYSVLLHSLDRDEIDGEERKLLRLEPEIAPYEVAVMPLMDKEGMGDKAKKLERKLLEKGFSVYHDDSGSIGRRYRRQDEIGTPYCVTVDHQTLEDGTVTIRDRDSTEQERHDTEELPEVLEELMRSNP